MATIRQAATEVSAEWWKEFIEEGRKLVATGQSKSNAARIVAANHPEAKIKPGTLRQKL
jgi:hypothetical protein